MKPLQNTETEVTRTNISDPACSSLRGAVLFHLFLACTAAPAANGEPITTMQSSIEYGTGSKLKMLRLALQSQPTNAWLEGGNNHLTMSWEISLAQWRGSAHQGVVGRHQYLADAGFTPIFRYESKSRSRWFLEGGIGIHVLSKLYNNNDDQLSTRAQFGDHIGTGYVFASGWEIGVKLQHFSNGGFKKPNSGADFFVFKLALTL